MSSCSTCLPAECQFYTKPKNNTYGNTTYPTSNQPPNCVDTTFSFLILPPLLNHDTMRQDEDTNESGNEDKGGWCDDNDDGKDDDKMTATVAGE